MIGQSINQYQITAKLGEGGMGEVYLAVDSKLTRNVALKFLSKSLSGSDEARQRFLREARAVASVNHPNIVTIYEVVGQEDPPFFAMEHVDGQSLRAYCNEGQHPIDELLQQIHQVGEGLRIAHQAGITHRDLKPENVLITSRGIAKLLDFGLAQVRGAARLTLEGATLGTVAYMSPEQIKGLDIDHRADIWALGVITYEVLTGRNPFHREFEQASIYAILNEDPEPPSTLNCEIPASLEHAILRMLAKDREKRPANVAEALRDLVMTPDSKSQSASPEPGIVVLPFEDISPNRDNEYFSDGLTEEIIADLSRIRSLRVISRTSAMRYKGTDRSMQTIGRELGVSHVLEGSVRKAGDKLRITAQLIETAGERHIWGQKYSGSLDDIFEIQEQVSQSIAQAMELTLTAQEERDMSARPISDPRAYDCYLQARRDIRWSEAELDRANRKLQMGLDMVGDNPVLFAGMGYLHYQYVNAGFRQDEDIAKAEEYVRKALAMDPDSPEAHLVAGMVGMAFRGEQVESLRHLKQALAARPNDTDTLFWSSVGYGCTGQIEEANPLVERLLWIDPFSPLAHMAAGWIEFMSGRFEGASTCCRRSSELGPSSLADFLWTLAMLYDGRTDEALAQIQLFTDMKFFLDRVMLMYLYSHLDRQSEAVELVTADVETTARRDPQWSWHLAAGYAAIGHDQPALDWLENAVGKGFSNYRMLSEYDPYLARLHNSERFKSIIKRARHARESF